MDQNLEPVHKGSATQNPSNPARNNHAPVLDHCWDGALCAGPALIQHWTARSVGGTSSEGRGKGGEGTQGQRQVNFCARDYAMGGNSPFTTRAL